MKGNQKPCDDDREEERDAVAFTWIRDATTRIAPPELGAMTLRQQQESVMSLAKKHGVTVRLLFGQVGDYERTAVVRMLSILDAVERHDARYVITPSELWISSDTRDMAWFVSELARRGVTLITQD